MGDLSKNFSRSEFACKCGCGKNDINTEFVNKLQQARDFAKVGFTISSGVRCVKHNTGEGGVDSSSHVNGLAADIACTDSRNRCEIISALIRAGFTRIGIAKTFVHVDVDTSKPQRVFWLY